MKVRQPSFVIFFQLENCFDVLGNGAVLYMCVLPLTVMAQLSRNTISGTSRLLSRSLN